MNKKAQGMPLRTIIISIIVIIVLVIVIFFFSNRFNVFSKGISDCKSGQTVIGSEDCPEEYPIKVLIDEKEGELTYCCNAIGS